MGESTPHDDALVTAVRHDQHSNKDAEQATSLEGGMVAWEARCSPDTTAAYPKKRIILNVKTIL